jgi:hypothetical protein
LGTLPDAEVAAEVGRTEKAVRVKRLRRRLRLGRADEGARAMRSAAADDPGLTEGQREAHAEAREQERRRKIAEARRGKPQSEETRRKISEGVWPPAGRPWTAEEDATVSVAQ